MNINMYINKSDPRKVYKHLQLLRENIDLQIYEEISIEEPTFIIRLDNIIPSCNYIYIPAWGRYYYANITINKDKAIISCEVDSLSTFFNSCGSSRVIARRSSSRPDARIEDNRVLKLKEPKINVRRVNASIPVTAGYNYVLTLTGR